MSLRVLVVDDSPIIRKILIKAINTCNIDINAVFQAENGIKALEVLKKEWIDVIFTDLNMPEMGGIELIENVRKDEAYSDTPVIVISSLQNEKIMEQAKALGVMYYIKKPFKPEQINLIFNDILGKLDPF